MTEGFPHPDGDIEAKEIVENGFNFKPEIDMATMYNIAVEWLKLSQKEVMRVCINAMTEKVPLTDDELIDLYDRTSRNLIHSENIQNEINKLFLQVQDMTSQVDKEKNSFIDMIKLDKTTIIAKWGKAGYVGMSILVGAVTWLITYLSTG